MDEKRIINSSNFKIHSFGNEKPLHLRILTNTRKASQCTAYELGQRRSLSFTWLINRNRKIETSLEKDVAMYIHFKWTRSLTQEFNISPVSFHMPSERHTQERSLPHGLSWQNIGDNLCVHRQGIGQMNVISLYSHATERDNIYELIEYNENKTKNSKCLDDKKIKVQG